jgi:hypothetical protein
MPDAVDTIHVDLALEGQQFIDELDDALEQGTAHAAGWSEEIGAALGEGIRAGMEEVLGQAVAEMADALGISAQDAAESIEAMGVAGGATADELVKMSESYKLDLLQQFQDVMNQVTEQIALGKPVSAETAAELANLSAQMENAKGSSQEMAAAVDQANAALARIAETTRTVQTRGGPTDSAAWEKTTEGVTGLSQGLNRVVGDFKKFGVGLVAGFTAYKLLGDVKQFIDGAVESSIRFTEVNYRLEVSIRALQRSQGEAIGTIAEWKAFADGLTETYSIQRAETYNLIAVAGRLTGELGASKEQIEGLVSAAVIMNQVAGIDATSALYRFTQFINTGYARGLTMMGFQVDRATQQQAALALGITKPIKEWTEQERVLVRTTLIQQQSNKYAADAAAGQDVLAKRIEEVNQKWADASKLLGDTLAPSVVALKETFADLFEKVVAGVRGFVLTIATIDTALAAFFETNASQSEKVAALVEQGMSRQEAVQQVALTRQQTFGETFARLWEVQARKVGIILESLGDDFGTEADEAAKALEEQKVAGEQAFAEIEAGLAELAKAYEEAAADIQQNFYDKLADLDEDLAQSREDAATNLSRDLSDIDRQADQDRLQAIRDDQVNELRIREDHQRALRDLESRYLLDLEDAVRDRDARQVLMLQRRFNLEKQKENEDYKVKQRRRQQDFQLELRQIEEQRQLKKQQRMLEYAEELEDLRIQDERKRADAEKARLQALRDLDIDNARKAKAIVDDAVRTYNLTKAGLDALNSLLQAEYGAGGYIDRLLTAAIARTQALSAQMAAALIGPGSAYFNSEKGINQPAGQNIGLTGQGTMVSGHTYSMGGRQRGGRFIATGPQTVGVGEGRPERVDITPLNAATGAPLAGFGGGAGNRIRIDLALRLAAGLEAEMVDQAVNEVAEVVLTMAQAEKTGFGGAQRSGGRQ